MNESFTQWLINATEHKKYDFFKNSGFAWVLQWFEKENNMLNISITYLIWNEAIAIQEQEDSHLRKTKNE